MKPVSAGLLLLVICGLAASGTVNAAGLGAMTIAPSVTTLAGGKAKLAITSLRWQTDGYRGEYKLTVTPYFFKNQTGKLSIIASEAEMRKLEGGAPVDFTGKAVTDGTGKTRAVRVKAFPSNADSNKGRLNIWIPTLHGELNFSTAYTLAD